MKHLFYVHSHITFLVSKQYIFDKNIDPGDCIFITTRSYSIPPKYAPTFTRVIEYPEILTSGNRRIFQGIHFLQTRRNRKELGNIINTHLKGDTFCFYIPNTQANDFVNVVVTMKKCVQYYLIEEGTATYVNSNVLPKFQSGFTNILYQFGLRLFLKRYYVLRDNMYSTSYYKYVGTISCSKMCFPNFTGSHFIINTPFYKENLRIIPDVILSIDPLFLHLNNHTAEFVYKKLASIIPPDVQLIAYKFHPEFYKQTEIQKLYERFLKQVFTCQLLELPQNTIIENILYTYHCDFYSDFSSIGIYGSQMNCKCYSYANIIKGQSESYDRIVDGLPEIIRNAYQFL
jgi:hypothetical protein